MCVCVCMCLCVCVRMCVCVCVGLILPWCCPTCSSGRRHGGQVFYSKPSLPEKDSPQVSKPQEKDSLTCTGSQAHPCSHQLWSSGNITKNRAGSGRAMLFGSTGRAPRRQDNPTDVQQMTHFVVIQLLSHIRFFENLWTAACPASLSFTVSLSLLKLTSIESVMRSNRLILCHPLLLPSIFPSIKVFSNESSLCIRWSKYWSFSFSISPSNEHSGLISFRTDCLDPLAVQGTPKSLLQHHSSNASILQCSAFFMVQLSHPHMTTGKTTALTMVFFF